MTFYRQCKLEAEGSFYVAWIPERFALEGNLVRINEKLWQIREVWSREEGSYLVRHERDHKTAFPSLAS